jgi:hypothetical protein
VCGWGRGSWFWKRDFWETETRGNNNTHKHTPLYPPRIRTNLYKQLINPLTPNPHHRLVDLNALHQDASTFSSRLTSLESTVAEANLVLSSCEGSLSKLEGGMGEVAERVKEEIEKLKELTEGRGEKK